MRATKIKIQDLSIPFLINSDNERHWPMRLICEISFIHQPSPTSRGRDHFGFYIP